MVKGTVVESTQKMQFYSSATFMHILCKQTY